MAILSSTLFITLIATTIGLLWIIHQEYQKRLAMEGRLIEPSFSFNKTGPNAFKCYQDPDYGNYSSISECQEAALKQNRRAGIDQKCSATRLCVDGAFCNNRNVCQVKKLVYQKCKGGECASGFYCNPQTGQCTPKGTVSKTTKCGPLYKCKNGTCVDGTCVPDTAFQMNLQMNQERFLLNIDAIDHSQFMRDPGLGVIGWNANKSIVFKNWYNIIDSAASKSESKRFVDDSKQWKRLGVQWVLIVLWKVLIPSRIDWRIRQLIELFGGRMIRYVDNNYVLFARVPDRMLIHEDVAKVLTYIRTEHIPALTRT